MPRWEYLNNKAFFQRAYSSKVQSGDNKSHKAKTCPKCRQAFSPDVSFCPNDGTKLPEELSTANSSEMLKFSSGSASGKLRSDSEKSGPQSGRSPGERARRASGREKSEKPQRQPAALDLSQELRAMHQAEADTIRTDGNNKQIPFPEARTRDAVVNSLVGQTLDDQYEILSIIGQGGMSVVYKARHLMLRKIVAIKTLLPHLVLHPLSLQRFQQEAQAASNIVHTNVVTIYNFGITPEGQPYLVMDYLEGISLQDLIANCGHLPIDRAIYIFCQVASALDLAHEKGVVHRDLKPSNIILVEQGEDKDVVQLVDFGIAKLLPQEGAESMALTQTGEVFGSPLYMSPEQAKGEKLDYRSDIYSMGCLMYETLAGKPPHNGDNALEVLYKHINDVPPSLSGGELKIPHALEAIVFKALAKSPDLRYQKMVELADDLESFQKAQQFSLIGIIKSRLELARLKKAPRTKNEKSAHKMVALAFLFLLIFSITYPAVTFWNIADSPAARQPLKWEDNRGTIRLKNDDQDVIATNFVIKMADDYLAHPKLEGFAETFHMCTMAGKKLIDQGLFEQAVTVLSKALKISGRYADAHSVPMLFVRQQRAQAYYDMGKFAEAADDYNMIVSLYNLDDHHDVTEQTMQIARAGNCYYYLERYDLAVRYYTKAIYTWARSSGAPSITDYAGEFGLQKLPTLELAALCYSRLGEIYQRAATKEIQRIDSDTPAQEYGHAARLFYQALPMWQRLEGEGGKNYSLCALHLAEVLAASPQSDLTRMAKIPGGDKFAQADKDPESLFRRAEAAMASKSSYGTSHPYYAIALIHHAQYRLSQHDYQNYIKMRLSACAILSSLKN